MSTKLYTESWRTGPQDTNFYVQVYTAAEPLAVLVFCHGAAEHCARYTEIHSAVSQDHRIPVFSFDMRGYGLTAADKTHKSPHSSYGKTWWPEQLDDLEWVIEEGGGIVLGPMCDLDPTNHPSLKYVNGVISCSPTFGLAKPLPGPVYWILKQITRMRPWMLFPIQNKPEELSRNTDLKGLTYMLEELCSYANWPQDLPVLFMHGDTDPVVSYPDSKAMFEKLPAQDKKMITYPGGYHELHFEPDGIREKSLQDLVEFIHTHV
ncbi:Alpha/Beta hydrolase protein [Mycena olivaceomarginata]|nr:Alpha/Beta hydrolase protein [Mycena olivaceomarginata]